MNIKIWFLAGLTVGVFIAPKSLFAQEPPGFSTTSYHDSILNSHKTTSNSTDILLHPDTLNFNAYLAPKQSSVPSLPTSIPSQPSTSGIPQNVHTPSLAPQALSTPLPTQSQGASNTETKTTNLFSLPRSHSNTSTLGLSPKVSNHTVFVTFTQFLSNLTNRFKGFFIRNSQPIPEYKSPY